MVIIYEAYNRWHNGEYVVWLPAVFCVGLLGFAVDLLRFKMLTNAYKHSANDTVFGLKEHAKSDALHSAVISAVALVAMGVSHLHIDADLYQYFVRLADYLVSLALAMYMLLRLTPRVWRGQGCSHKHRHNSAHTHQPGEKCSSDYNH